MCFQQGAVYLVNLGKQQFLSNSCRALTRRPNAGRKPNLLLIWLVGRGRVRPNDADPADVAKVHEATRRCDGHRFEPRNAAACGMLLNVYKLLSSMELARMVKSMSAAVSTGRAEPRQGAGPGVAGQNNPVAKILTIFLT